MSLEQPNRDASGVFVRDVPGSRQIEYVCAHWNSKDYLVERLDHYKRKRLERDRLSHGLNAEMLANSSASSFTT